MVSTYPNSQPADLTFTYRQYEQCHINKQQVNSDSLLSIIKSNQQFSNFYQIVQKANMENVLNCLDSRMTLFVPTNTALQDYCLDNIDLLFAKNQVNKHIVLSQLSIELLSDTPYMYLQNRKKQRLLISNVNKNIYLNNNVKILNNDNKYQAKNGIIHVVSDLI